jgi:hypothetical protein
LDYAKDREMFWTLRQLTAAERIWVQRYAGLWCYNRATLDQRRIRQYPPRSETHKPLVFGARDIVQASPHNTDDFCFLDESFKVKSRALSSCRSPRKVSQGGFTLVAFAYGRRRHRVDYNPISSSACQGRIRLLRSVASLWG